MRHVFCLCLESYVSINRVISRSKSSFSIFHNTPSQSSGLRAVIRVRELMSWPNACRCWRSIHMPVQDTSGSTDRRFCFTASS